MKASVAKEGEWRQHMGMIVTAQEVPVVLPNIDPEIAQQIEEKVSHYVNNLVTLDPQSAQFEAEIAGVHHLGDNEIRASASASNGLLDRPPATMSLSKFAAYSKIPTDLQQLRKIVEKLDPVRQGLTDEGGIMSKVRRALPFADSLQSYTKRYDSAQGHLNAILRSLYNGSQDLKSTNGSLEQEKANLWKIKKHLEECAYMVSSLEAHLAEKVNEIRGTNPDLAKKLEEDALFYVRQKYQDILTQIAVSSQSILAMEIIQKNNFELVKGVDRTTTTTVSALRTAIIIAQALHHQRHVLAQIKAISGTASNLIEKTSEVLQSQSGDIYDQASSATLDVDKLKTAFQNVYGSIDAIEGFRVKALETMNRTVLVLSGEVEKAKDYLKKSSMKELPAGEETEE